MIGISDIPALDEMAFEGRNKAYGAYFLRKRYYRYLLISIFAGIFIVLSGVFSVYAYFYFKPVPFYEGELMYEVDYMPMSLPPDDELSMLAQSYAMPPREKDLAPVVTDSIPMEKEKPDDVTPEEKPEEVKLTTDSAAKPGGSGLGEEPGEDTGLATSIDVHPRYPGGDESRLNYLRRNVRYPEPALKGLIQGVVMVVFVVETDGSITNVNLAKRIGGGCDEEAIRVTTGMPRWEPGKRHGRPVRVMVRMPIVFRIPGKPSS
jgi:protein TonB